MDEANVSDEFPLHIMNDGATGDIYLGRLLSNDGNSYHTSLPRCSLTKRDIDDWMSWVKRLAKQEDDPSLIVTTIGC
jgi:hypothetical protein